MFKEYDIIVVGGGHAGCEAAAAAANMGSRVLLITMNMNTLGQMSCNPAMGGVAKGQIIREIDSLGGYSGIIADKSMIQFRMLNRSKGPAMWSPRSQNDRFKFTEAWRLTLEKHKNIDFWQEMVSGILIKEGRALGVKTALGLEIKSKKVILTNGTFLNGVIHIGEKSYGGGRSAEKAATGITEQLVKLGFESGRMKTGTPPRIDGRSLDYIKMEEQLGDENPSKFSFTDTPTLEKQKKCWIAHTNKNVHAELEKGFKKSPMFQGRIKGIGPRYCPSIEDKITRFAERDQHQLFIEPEGWNTVEIYLNGFSTSLPEIVQYQAIKKIPGFENVKMFRPGYAIEYDYFPPSQLKNSLETQRIDNLFFAGQINGTTGYEEAACQGLMAGINAHNEIKEKEPLILKRSEAYIGVLIDDLVNKSINEPYRMFTSRAEYRILLRQDNADLRLTEIGHKIGLASDKRLENVLIKKNHINLLTESLQDIKIDPNEANHRLTTIPSSPIRDPQPLVQFLKRPEIHFSDLPIICPSIKKFVSSYTKEEKEQLEIQVKYNAYINRERKLVKKMESLETFNIRSDFNYDKVKALSSEAREQLKKVKPGTIGQLSRMSGVSPADVHVLTVYMGR